MGKSIRLPRPRFPRRLLPVLAIVGQLMIAFGYPSLANTGDLKWGSVPFPCQARQCGCLTAELCWQGDCCCFTLEQKLAWADENGIEPPEHVRPLVESRREHSPPPKGESCCEKAEPSCCHEKPKPPVIALSHWGKERDKAPVPSRWVIGLFAQKCRGDRSAGLFQLQSTAVPDSSPVMPIEPQCSGRTYAVAEVLVSLNFRPPTPPPRAV